MYAENERRVAGSVEAGKVEAQHEKEARRARIRAENQFVERYKSIRAKDIVPVLQSFRDKLNNNGYYCRILQWPYRKNPGHRAMPCVALQVGGKSCVRFTPDFDSQTIQVTHDTLVSRFGEVEESSQVLTVATDDLTRKTVEEVVTKYVEGRLKTVQPIRPVKIHL